ncbi:putative quinol monooxygenase [Pseudomonas sp. LRF_L74]|uniref:putative quinol monooxygenase n=1 Tax=Pseudomonas sp. LRF_L74 TaxID=3369422 RepID=UPI003F64055C
MSQPYAFILHAHTLAEQADAFEALFKGYVEPSRAESGCLEYHMLRDRQDPTLFIFFEVWRSKEHFDAHCALPHMQRFQAQRMEFLRNDFEVRMIDMLSQSSASR